MPQAPTYYLFEMPRWDRRLRMILDWTVALFFRPDITKIELAVEQDQARSIGAAVADCRAIDTKVLLPAVPKIVQPPPGNRVEVASQQI